MSELSRFEAQQMLRNRTGRQVLDNMTNFRKLWELLWAAELWTDEVHAQFAGFVWSETLAIARDRYLSDKVPAALHYTFDLFYRKDPDHPVWGLPKMQASWVDDCLVPAIAGAYCSDWLPYDVVEAAAQRRLCDFARSLLDMPTAAAAVEDVINTW